MRWKTSPKLNQFVTCLDIGQGKHATSKKAIHYCSSSAMYWVKYLVEQLMLLDVEKVRQSRDCGCGTLRFG